MRHRVFIAINLPKEIKKKLLEYQKKWPELPTRWLKEDNLHITLVFLGYLSDEETAEVCQIVKETVQKYQPFVINLKRICYGPPGKMPPRMIWVQGEKSENLANLKNDFEKSLLGKISFISNGRRFSPHITLARIKTLDWRKIEPEERPEIEETLSLSFDVNSIEVMESKLKKGGAEYAILESVSLNADSINF